jgi:multidrug transporter EmrE-like cation transporter
MNTLAILLSAGFILTLGDIVAGKWVQDKSRALYIGTLVLYMIGLNFLIYSYKFEDIAIASVSMEIFNIVTLTLVGKFFFKQHITKTETLGIVVGLLAVLLLENS